MTCRSISIFLRTAAIMPALGVVPPSGRPAHNSTRSAPPRSELTADSTESIQISSRLWPDEFAVELPHAATVLTHHGLAGSATECLLEFRHVYHQPIYAIFAGRMLISDGISAKVFRTVILASPLRIANKEALVGRKAVTDFQLLALCIHLPGHVCKDQPAQIGNV